MKRTVYDAVKEFNQKYPLSVGWRLKRHCKVIEQFLNPDEEVLYAFFAQKNDNPLDIITTYVIALTSKRILIGTKRVVFGYFYTTITPDMFNDLKVHSGIIWGKVYLDTVKEYVTLSKIQKDALDEIETKVTEYMIEDKKKYGNVQR